MKNEAPPNPHRVPRRAEHPEFVPLEAGSDVLEDGRLLTLPNPEVLTKSIRATAQVFEDPRSQALLARIQLVAPSEANVLIIGDTGTGKELIARHVHALSARRNGPFVAVNCGAFSETLVESELFGHEKGAFTGAFAAKAGWFEAANEGTLFLDEIGDLPLNIQVKLLRVLQEREVVRLGARRPVPINVRLIAATNVRLEEAVRAGHFREDLFYRLRVVHLELLPLRERPGDILPLARHFIAQYSRRLGYGGIALHPETEHKLRTHSWPGNIRELENVIHHGLLIARDGVLRPEDLYLSTLNLERQGPAEVLAAPAPAPLVPEDALVLLEQALHALFEECHDDLFEKIEDVVMRAAYHYCHRNQVQAARLLGVSRNVIRARLIRMGAISALK
ncbi:sigma-54 interaction domain-containing protein [Zoogloea sp.]|uniref:sigma-54 interaction domain-containing protein n=1 Tax=Zoogloea sp. TaxID=49181 RepID=UPI0035B4CE74